MAGTWPTDILRETETLESVFFNFVSRTQSGNRNARTGDRHMWKMHIRTPFLNRAQQQKLFAFGVKQNGRFDTFTVTTTMLNPMLGLASGAGLIVGAHAQGVSQISTDGWSNNITGLFKAGDLIKFANHKKVYMVVDDAASNGSGEAVLNIKPSLVTALINNEAITYDDVPFTMAFEKDPLKLEGDVNRYASFEVTLEEVWNS